MPLHEEDAKSRAPYELGQPLDLMSVAEIDATIEKLRAEIARLETVRGQKQAAGAAAEAFFKN